MPRSGLLVRLLAVSLVVAVASIATTAYLTTRSTTNQLEHTRARALEIDNDIADRLLEHGMSFPDWRAVAGLVDELATATGRDIRVSSPDGGVLADSSGRADRTRLPPSAAAATLDPLAELATSSPTARPLEELQAGPHPALVRFAQVRDEQGGQALGEVDDCVGAEGIVVLAGSVDARSFAGMVGDDIIDGPLRLLPPKDDRVAASATCPMVEPRHLGVQAEIVDRVVACLERRSQSPARGIDVHTGLALLLPADRATSAAPRPSTTVGDTLPTDDATSCELEAVRSVFAPHLAPPALLHLSSPPAPEPTLVDRLGSRSALPALAVVLVITFAASAWAARRVLRPVRELTGTAQRISAGDRSARVRVQGSDEVAQLGQAFNTMVDAVESGELQRNALINDVAHELRNPLAVVRGHLEGARDRVVEPDDDFVESLLEETLMLQRLVDDLQDLALAEAGRLVLAAEPLDAVDLVAQVVGGQRSRAQRVGVTVTVVGSPPAPLVGDPIRLRQVLSNLVENAITHTSRGGAVTVTVDIDQGSESNPGGGETVSIAVADTGTGIAAEHLPHLFDRFYRVDPSRSRRSGGAGLGLAIARQLVEAHGGELAASSRVGVGTTVVARLPTAERTRRPGSTTDASGAGSAVPAPPIRGRS